MKIIRQNLYFISTDPNLEKTIINPTIPSDILTKSKSINYKTPRIKLYRDIDSAISGNMLGLNLEGLNLFVYKASSIRSESLIGPINITEIPYASVLEEWWSLANCKMKLLGEIRIGSKKEILTYKYGPRQTKANIYKWNWTEIKKPYQHTSNLNTK